MPKDVTAKTVVEVLRRLADFVAKEPIEQRRLFAQDVNRMLDGIVDQDGFGTEGQCDPRGDHRND